MAVVGTVKLLHLSRPALRRFELCPSSPSDSNLRHGSLVRSCEPLVSRMLTELVTSDTQLFQSMESLLAGPTSDLTTGFTATVSALRIVQAELQYHSRAVTKMARY